MFGFAQVRKDQLTTDEYNQLKTYYCGLCHALRQDFGLASAALTGWDGRFLALLVDSQLQKPEFLCMTRCPASIGFLHQPIVSHDVATRYAAAATVFLFGEKLDDRIEDDESQLAKTLKSLTRSQINKAIEILIDLDFPLSNAIALKEKQKTVESKKRGNDFWTVTAPSSQAVALIFSHTAKLTGAESNIKPLVEIGSCVGKLITILDACYDYKEDIKKDKFNAIAACLPIDGPAQPISNHFYEVVRNFLLLQLKEIRSQVKRLSLRRHNHLVENVLFLGLYDATESACYKLAKSVVDSEIIVLTECNCPTCGKAINSRFCTNCGTNLYLTRKEKVHEQSTNLSNL